MTARRDLIVLEQRGVAHRTHGGAVLPALAPPEEDTFSARLQRGTAAKHRIAQAACDLIGEDETIVLDSSSTAYALAQRLAARTAAVGVVTNSLPVAEVFSRREAPGCSITLAGGVLRRDTRSFVGLETIRVLQGHYADRAIVSCSAIAFDGVVLEADRDEAAVKRAMLGQAGANVLLVDASKLGGHASFRIAHADEFAELVTDGIDADVRAQLIE
jgi:DeoR/GlpR family transcriptional regulator of sugar metabolism